MRWFDPAYQNLAIGDANTPLDGTETTLISQGDSLREADISSLWPSLSFVATSNPTTNASLLLSALAVSNDVIVPSGTYDNLTISSSGKTLRMQSGVTFKLPNGTVLAGATSGPAVLSITGSNVTIYGDFTVDGNKANNNASSFPSSVLTGALNVSGANCRIEGIVTLQNPYYIGLAVNGGSSAGQEVAGFYCTKVKIFAPFHYSVLLWSVIGWYIGEIEVDRNTTLGWDARVRLGSQTISTAVCQTGHIDSVKTNGVFVTEANTSDVTVDSIISAGGKLQESTNVVVEYWRSKGELLLTDEAGNSLGFIQDTRCSVKTSIITGHNSSAVAFGVTSGCVDCSVGFLSISGTQTNVEDCIISKIDGFRADVIMCTSPVGTGNGFHLDTDATYSPQRDIVIGAVISRGHTTTDILLESTVSGSYYDIKYANPDAKFSTGTGFGPSGTFTWATGTASQAVSNVFVTATSIVNVIPIDLAAGAVVKTSGHFVTVGAGSFTIHTGDGTNTANNSNWNYTVDKAWVG